MPKAHYAVSAPIVQTSDFYLGVDIVIHSATKYLGGHNDLLAGVALEITKSSTPCTVCRG